MALVPLAIDWLKEQVIKWTSDIMTQPRNECNGCIRNPSVKSQHRFVGFAECQIQFFNDCLLQRSCGEAIQAGVTSIVSYKLEKRDRMHAYYRGKRKSHKLCSGKTPVIIKSVKSVINARIFLRNYKRSERKVSPLSVVITANNILGFICLTEVWQGSTDGRKRQISGKACRLSGTSITHSIKLVPGGGGCQSFFYSRVIIQDGRIYIKC